ncbi:hypothetical protein N7452_005543 [Penicillium brevicompactum]|uniref:Uncharacterized protein n=1 Tax=Penicillium brevicompactum TaxID=5074 RepID=A0A9W9QK21_PENBR|nr:hypothetical protein N7452_005543 [Penicillium brevicompactum]
MHYESLIYAHSVLLFSSFTPFIVQFLHAVTYKDQEDLQILEDVVRTLEGVKEASKASKRPSIGKYDADQRSLQLADGFHRPSTSQSVTFQDPWDIDFTDDLGSLAASGILDGWASGQPLMLNIFDDNTMWN